MLRLGGHSMSDVVRMHSSWRWSDTLASCTWGSEGLVSTTTYPEVCSPEYDAVRTAPDVTIAGCRCRFCSPLPPEVGHDGYTDFERSQMPLGSIRSIDGLPGRRSPTPEEATELALAERLMAQGVPLDLMTIWFLLEMAKRNANLQAEWPDGAATVMDAWNAADKENQ